LDAGLGGSRRAFANRTLFRGVVMGMRRIDIYLLSGLLLAVLVLLTAACGGGSY